MKIALISDLHFGCKKSDKVFLDNQLNYFKNEFIPKLKELNISNIAILGDLFDNRVNINALMKYEVHKLFELFEEENLFVYIFPGNHDIYFRTSIDVHSLVFLKKFKNVKLFEDVELIDIDNRKILFVPWQIDYNEFKNKIENINCDICLGHFDIIGFPFDGTVCHDGVDPNNLVSKFTLTFSGHFHKRHIYRNNEKSVVMIGSPYQITRSDKQDERGFCVVDLENLTYEFVNGQNTIKFIDVIFPEEFDEKLIKGNVIDVTVNYDGRLIDNDLKIYIEEIEKLNPAYPPNIFVNNSLFDNISENIEIKTLSEMFDEFVGNLNIENKKEIKEIINDLYIAAKGN